MTQMGWNELQIDVAVYINGGYGLNEYSWVYGVPKGGKLACERRRVPRETSCVFSRYRDDSSWPYYIRGVRKLASDLAEKYKLPHTFNKEKKLAGKMVLCAFMRRNRRLSVRQSEATSVATAKGLNRYSVLVLHFSDLLESKIAKMFDVDEYGFSAE
jgi:hypothetical protein